MKTFVKPFLALGASAIASAVLAVPAAAQVKSLLPFHKTGDVLIGDVFNGVVLRASDLSSDGTYLQPGELSLYFDPAAALDPTTGLTYGVGIGAPSVITGDLQANVYVVAQGPPALIFRLRDTNGDGDANDPGESRLWFDAASNPLCSADPVNGAAVDPSGTLWITVDRSSNDLVMTLTDVNQDGDANDAGESAVVFEDAQSGMALQNLAWAGFTPAGVFYMQNAAGFHRFTLTLKDNSTPPNGLLHDSGDASSSSRRRTSMATERMTTRARPSSTSRVSTGESPSSRVSSSTSGATARRSSRISVRARSSCS
jgi:hypothetical protein